MNRKFIAWKWVNLIAFSMMYTTMYIGRYSFNNSLPAIALEFSFSEGIEELLYSSVFFAYAAGCLVNGYFADTGRPKHMIVIGAAGSVAANIAMHFAHSWGLMLVISLFNGYMQSMVWVSGIAILVKWWRSEERGIAIGIANLSSSFSYIVMIAASGMESGSLKDTIWGGLFFPMSFLCYSTIIFYMASREEPGDVNLPEYEETEAVLELEGKLLAEVPRGLFHAIGYFLKNANVWRWGAIGFLSNLCRYGFLSWVPLYYSTGDSSVTLDTYTSNAGISMGMALGTLVIAFIAGKYYHDNIGVMATICAGICAAVAIIFPVLDMSAAAISSMFFTGFFLFGINGLLWLFAMESGTRIYAATVTGILNCFAYVGATGERSLFSFILEAIGDWMSVFAAIDLICVGMVLLGIFTCKWRLRNL